MPSRNEKNYEQCNVPKNLVIKPKKGGKTRSRKFLNNFSASVGLNKDNEIKKGAKNLSNLQLKLEIHRYVKNLFIVCRI